MASKHSYQLFDITLARRTQVSASLVKFTFTGPDANAEGPKQGYEWKPLKAPNQDCPLSSPRHEWLVTFIKRFDNSHTSPQEKRHA